MANNTTAVHCKTRNKFYSQTVRKKLLSQKSLKKKLQIIRLIRTTISSTPDARRSIIKISQNKNLTRILFFELSSLGQVLSIKSIFW